MPKHPSQKTVEQAIKALDGVRRDWLRRPGVTAVDVGFKITDNTLTDTVALRVHVARKLPVAELTASEVFNEAGEEQVGGFPVDVIEAIYGVSSAIVLDYDNEAAIEEVNRKTALDPILGGISCGNPRVTAGTIGAIVFNRTSGSPMILSNWHVLAGARTAAVGEAILQPGQIDGGTQTVATLTRMVLDSRMDAAVATLNGTRGHSADILGLGSVTGIDTPTLGMLVVKSGRTTGITRGVVDGVSMSVNINYGTTAAPDVVMFNNQIRIVPRAPWPGVDYEVSRGGDSGSVWLNEANRRAIGLHFAGETDPAPSAENAICSPMAPIATEFNFSFSPVLRPVFNICDRYPQICELLRTWRFRLPDPIWPKLPPLPPIPPIPPIPPVFQDAQAGGGCRCSGEAAAPAPQSQEMAMLMAVLSALMEDNGR